MNNSPPLLLNDTVIERVNCHRHLGLYLTSSLDWGEQVHQVCLKANKKLSVLRSVKLLNRQTLDLLYKLTVRSVIDYALPGYHKNLKQTDIARLENLQHRAAKMVTGALHFTYKEKPNLELGWEATMKRGDFLGLPFVRKCMPKLDFRYVLWKF